MYPPATLQLTDMPAASSTANGEALVFVVDDDRSMRDALSGLVRSVGLQVQSFATAREFLQQTRPDTVQCLILDVRMPGGSGLELQQQLGERGDPLPIVFLTAHGDVPMSVRAMKAGAVEFLLKPFSEQDLLDAITAALERDRAERAARAERISIQQRYAELTAREREVLVHVVNGSLNKQAAAALGISEITVKVHRRHIMEKMCAPSLAALLNMVGKLGPY